MRILKLRRVEVVILIYHQSLLTNLQGNELKPEERINNQILGGMVHSFYRAIVWSLDSIAD